MQQHPASTQQRDRTALLIGAILGFSVYTYPAYVALFAAFGAWGGVALRRAGGWRRGARAWLLAGGLAVLLAAPMAYTRLTDQSSSFRYEVVGAPWRELRAGNPDLVLENACVLVGMFTERGDHEWRYNMRDRPLLGWPLGALLLPALLWLGVAGLARAPGRRRCWPCCSWVFAQSAFDWGAFVFARHSGDPGRLPEPAPASAGVPWGACRGGGASVGQRGCCAWGCWPGATSPPTS
ncbi:MAG: hypothetical protein HC915_11655 [Anaerolineae bacterium]|nr:hypothetical protein [Anaerolineae bacterium]